MKKGNAAVWIVAVVVVLLVLGYALKNRGSAPTGGESAVAANSLSAGEQAAGKEAVIASVELKDAAHLVIHAAGPDGSPAGVLGLVSLQPGSYQNVNVTLSEEAASGATLYAMLHPDLEGNGQYDAAAEGTPMTGADGAPLNVMLTVK